MQWTQWHWTVYLTCNTYSKKNNDDKWEKIAGILKYSLCGVRQSTFNLCNWFRNIRIEAFDRTANKISCAALRVRMRFRTAYHHSPLHSCPPQSTLVQNSTRRTFNSGMLQLYITDFNCWYLFIKCKQRKAQPRLFDGVCVCVSVEPVQRPPEDKWKRSIERHLFRFICHGKLHTRLQSSLKVYVYLRIYCCCSCCCCTLKWNAHSTPHNVM